MSRKVFLITISVLMVIIIGSLLYLFVFSKETTETPSGEIPDSSDTVPAPSGPSTPKINTPVVPEAAKIEQVLENRVLGFALKGNKIVYYDQDQGMFNQADLDGSRPTPYCYAKFANVEKIIWSPDRGEAIIGFDNGSFYHFDIASEVSTKLMPDIQNISWLPQGNKIVYEWEESKNDTKLIISEPDGDNWEKIKDLGYTEVFLTASAEIGGAVAYLQNYSYGAGRNVYPVYQDGSAGQVMQIEGYGDKAKWSRDGLRILYEAVDSETLEQYLWVVDVTGTNQYNLGVKTFVGKCVWNKSNDKLYCAVPSEILGPEATIEDESIDNFWEIDTKTGDKLILYDVSYSDTKFDAENLWLNLAEDRLYFTDEGGGAYVLRLD